METAHQIGFKKIKKVSLRENIYFFAITSIIIAFSWVFWNQNHNSLSLCLFKNVTGLPCPACGTTTSIEYILGGDWELAWYSNPLGYVMGGSLLVVFALTLIDLIFKKKYLLTVYDKIQSKLKEKPIYTLIAILVISNWIWNILKTYVN